MPKPDSLVYVADENFDFRIVKTLREKAIQCSLLLNHFPVFQIRRFCKLLLTEMPFYLQKIKTLANLFIGSVCHTVEFY
jgi:hypothetical protein